MAKENRNHDQLNTNDIEEGDGYNANHTVNENQDRQMTDPPKENPFSFKHFLKRDTTSNNTINHSQSHHTSFVNENVPSSSTQSPSKSATTSSLSNSTGARPKIPQFQSVNVIQNQADSKMKRSPKFSSFDSQSSLSELAADERNMHGSRSNNSFNTDYPAAATTRSYSNYDFEPSSSLLDRNTRQQHHLGTIRSYEAQRSQSNVNNTSNSTMLPDFVQDHLLMEYYNMNNNNSSANMSPVSGDDFSLGNDLVNHQDGSKSTRNMQNDLPFDLTFNRSPNSRRRGNHHPNIPLDLPANDLLQRTVPSDLPPDLMEGSAAGSDGVAVQREETSQTLPDFLSDGPIHSSGRLADVATHSADEDNVSIIIRLQQENERLRMDLEENRRVMLEQSSRMMDMESQIQNAKLMETQYNVTLAESMEQVEENLFASNQRAVSAQAQASKYKQQVKQLTMELHNLRRENDALKEGGAVGGIPMITPNRNNNRNIARDLRLAASSAESNLRQLLNGVDNLRLIASTIENMDSFSGATNVDYLSDSDENDNEGPAL